MGVELSCLEPAPNSAEIIRPYDVDIRGDGRHDGASRSPWEVHASPRARPVRLLAKTPDPLADAISETVRSITTGRRTAFALRPCSNQGREGKRVAHRGRRDLNRCVDRARALRLLRGVGAEIVVIGTLVTEAVDLANLARRGRVDGARARIDPRFSTDGSGVSSKTGRITVPMTTPRAEARGVAFTNL